MTIEHVPKFYNGDANWLAQHAFGYRPMEGVMALELPADNWRKETVDYLENPSKKVSRRIRCLDKEVAKVLMGEIHEGVCGSHQSAYKMKWVIRRNGYFWPTMLEDCFTYYKGCQECQKFGSVQRVPASVMNPIIKPWPFRGWGIDLIGQIYPLSSKNHKFILVATDYFTKWVEAIPLKNIMSKEIIEFVKEHIIYRFGIP